MQSPDRTDCQRKNRTGHQAGAGTGLGYSVYGQYADLPKDEYRNSKNVPAGNEGDKALPDGYMRTFRNIQRI